MGEKKKDAYALLSFAERERELREMVKFVGANGV